MNAFAAGLAGFWLSVATHLWQTTLVLLPILLLARWMRSAPARWLYFLWSVAFLKLFLPLAVCGELLRWLGRTIPLVPFGAGGSNAHGLDLVSALLDPTEALSLGATRSGALVAVGLVALTLLWAIVASHSLLFLARQCRAQSRNAGLPADRLPPAERARLELALAGTPIPPACIQLTAERQLPHVAGLLRPRILVPRFLIGALAPAELRAILLHEEAHRRRHDPLRGALQRLCTSLLFFYPPLGLLVRKLQQATEFVCDEYAVRAGACRETYARALARTLGLGLVPVARPLSAGVGGESFLHRRFERLSPAGGPVVMKRHRLILASAVLLVAAGSFLPLPLAAPAAEPQTDELILPRLASDARALPAYPQAERQAGIEATVLLVVDVKADGTVGNVTVKEGVEGHAAFAAAATTAVRQWRFEPGTRLGKPVDCTVTIPVQFNLRAKKK